MNEVVALGLTERVAAFTTDLVEMAVVRKKFSIYGSILLDKDVRRILSYFTQTLGTVTARKIMRRLLQVSQLLNLDEVGDVYEIYENEMATILSKGLSQSEIKRVLALRKDFAPADIQRVKLS